MPESVAIPFLLGRLSAADLETARCVAGTLFPAEGVIPVDAEQAEVSAYFQDYFDRLPNLEQAQVRALLQAVELGFAAWSRSPRARFTTASPEDRWTFLEAWSQSSNHYQRMIFDGLRTVFLLGYVDSIPVRKLINNFGDGGPTDGTTIPTTSVLSAREM